MRIPLSWLLEYIDTELSPLNLAKELTMLGLEVESIEQQTQPFEGVVVALVVAVEPHPHADHLQIAKVYDGESTVQVVCGAPNCRKGIKTAFAKLGACLDKETKPFKIKQATIRGVDSYGMLCSMKELGLNEQDQGIIEFADHIVEGADVAQMYADTSLEIAFTPNLGHCASVYGIARELSSLKGGLKELPYQLANGQLHKQPTLYDVDIQEPNLCFRYCCRTVYGVKVAPSPLWLQQRLEASGIRPVNNVVDVTNYLLIELGQPLHAFDVSKLEGDKITIRRAKKGETLLTLNGQQLIFEGNELLIADQAKPLAFAGVVGGENTKIDEFTQQLLLECAHFVPHAIRKASRRHGISTDSSLRFEKGVDPDMIEVVLDRACKLLIEIGAAESCASSVSERYPLKTTAVTIPLRLHRVNDLLGITIGSQELQRIFSNLSMRCVWQEDKLCLVTPPSYRQDIRNEIDLVEEVARLYGYDKIGRHLSPYRNGTLPEEPLYGFNRELQRLLIAEGLQELICCDLISRNDLEKSCYDASSKELIYLANPNSLDHALMRPNMLPSILQVVKYNIDHGNSSIAAFELGRIHYKEGERLLSKDTLSLLLTGLKKGVHWQEKSEPFDFFCLKGMIENLIRALHIDNIQMEQAILPQLHPHRQLQIKTDQYELGAFGQVHPSITRSWGIEQNVFFAQLCLKDLMLSKPLSLTMQPLPLYPHSKWDWTVHLPETISWGMVAAALREVPSRLLKSFELVGIYRGEGVAEGYKSVTMRLLFRDDKKTLSHGAVEAEFARITSQVTKKFEIKP